jgi:IPT/TIG domain
VAQRFVESPNQIDEGIEGRRGRVERNDKSGKAAREGFAMHTQRRFSAATYRVGVDIHAPEPSVIRPTTKHKHCSLLLRLRWPLLFMLFLMPLVSHAQRVLDPCQMFGIGNCDITLGRIALVYWDTDLPTYDSHVMSSTAVTAPLHAAVDEYLAVLLHTSYRNGLAQYGVANVFAVPSVAAGSCAATPRASLSDLFSNGSDVNPMIQCVMTANPSLGQGDGQLVLAFILPPAPGGADSAFCQSQPGGLGAWHDQQSQAYIVIPVDCNNKDLASIEELFSHELVESLTDPHPFTGWDAWFSPTSGGGEIADLCETTSTPSTPFLFFGSVATYFSNQTNSCISSLNPPPQPALSNVSVCGSGPFMTVTGTGTQLPFPTWDITSNAFGGQTAYIQVMVNTPTGFWSAGLPVTTFGNQLTSPVQFQSIQANSTQFTLTDFNSSYGSATSSGMMQTAPPGSTITVAVADPNSGATLMSPISASVLPPTNFVGGISAQNPGDSADIFVNQSATISGVLFDSLNCADASIPVTFAASSGAFASTSLSQSTVNTAPNGYVSTIYNTPPIAGAVTITATSAQTVAGAPPATSPPITLNVLPVVTSINPASGPATGNQAVTITGNGFAGPSSTTFSSGSKTNNSPMTAPQSLTALNVTTPSSPFAGNGYGIATVMVTVNGEAAATPLSYTFLPSFSPVITGTQNAFCGPITITVNAYDASGQALSSGAVSYRIVLTGPANSIQGPNGPTNSVDLGLGSSVQVTSDGPFTAELQSRVSPTAVWLDVASATQSFSFLLNSRICNGFPSQGGWNPSGGPAAGILKLHIGVCPVPCAFQTPVFFGQLGDAVDPTSVAMLSGASIAKQMSIKVLSQTQSRALVEEHSTLLLSQPGAAQFRTSIIQIAHSGSVEGNLPAPAILEISRSGVRLPAGSHLEVFHLRHDGNSFAWTKDGISNEHVNARVVHANIQELGSYIVVEVRSQRP